MHASYHDAPVRLPLTFGSEAAMSESLARNWWAVALRGILAILFGATAFILPGATMLSFVLLFAGSAVADGVFAITSAVRSARRHQRWAFLVLEGLVDIVAGVAARLWPGLTLVAFVLLLAVWALLSGGLMTVAAFRLKLDHGRWWFILSGLTSIVYGVLLIGAPLIGALVLTWWLGSYAIVFGLLLLVLAYRLRSMSDAGPQIGVPSSATP